MLEFIEGFGPWAPLIVFFAAYSETAAFLGFIVPGETLMIAGGAAAAIGGAPIAVVMGAAIVGAILGDATGYLIGRKYGTSLLEHRLLQRFQDPVDRAGEFLERNGWWALILARFLSMLRAVVPFAAGAAQMPYGRFAIGNIAGSILYGGAISGFGYWAGSRWETIEGVVRRGGLTLGLLALVIGSIILGTRWITKHRVRVERALARWGRLPLVGKVLRAGVTPSGRVRPFLSLAPQLGLGLAALAAFTLAGIIDWSFAEAAVVRRIQGVDPAVFDVATNLSSLMKSPLVGGTLVALVLLLTATLGWRAGALVLASSGAAAAISYVLNIQIDRPFGPVDLELALPPNFPDAVIAVGTAIALSLAWPWKAKWTRGVIRLGAAAIVVTLLATARAVRVAAYPVDIIAGVALGATMVVVAGVMLDDRLKQRLSTVPDPRGIGIVAPPETVPAHERPPV